MPNSNQVNKIDAQLQSFTRLDLESKRTCASWYEQQLSHLNLLSLQSVSVLLKFLRQLVIEVFWKRIQCDNCNYNNNFFMNYKLDWFHDSNLFDVDTEVKEILVFTSHSFAIQTPSLTR
jgi:hypothetical protein